MSMIPTSHKITAQSTTGAQKIKAVAKALTKKPAAKKQKAAVPKLPGTGRYDPVTPGSQYTWGQLRRERQAAEKLQFGPDAVKKMQAREQDVAGYYDDYRRLLAQHQANVQGYGDTAVQQMASLANGEQAPNTAGLSTENAAIARGALAARQGAVQQAGIGEAGQGRAANTFADSLTNVVAPLAKIAAGRRQQQATDDLRDKIGAWRTKYQADKISGEQQSVLAQAIAQGKTQTELAKIAQAAQAAQARNQLAASSASEKARHNRAMETAANRRAASKPKKPAKSPWGPLAAQNTAKSDLERGIDIAAQLVGSGTATQQVLASLASGRSGAGGRSAISPIKNAAIRQAALDVVQTGRFSKATVKALHAAGIKVNQLGYNTAPSPTTIARIKDGKSTGAASLLPRIFPEDDKQK